MRLPEVVRGRRWYLGRLELATTFLLSHHAVIL